MCRSSVELRVVWLIVLKFLLESGSKFAFILMKLHNLQQLLVTRIYLGFLSEGFTHMKTCLHFN